MGYLKKKLSQLSIVTKHKNQLIKSTFKICKSMKYNITKQSAPKMPDLGRGTECIKIPLSKA